MTSIKRGDIYYVKLDNTGKHIQKGVRPCLIIQNDKGNRFSPNTIVAPITTAKKPDLETHVHIPYGGNIKGTILCEAVVTISKDSIIGEESVDRLDQKMMNKVDHALKVSVGL